MPKFNALGAIIPDSNGNVSAPQGQYWKNPNTLAEIPDPNIGAAAGNTQNAYNKAVLGGLFGGGGSSSFSGLQAAAGVGGSGTPGVGGTVPSNVNPIAPIDMSGAQSAAFGAAKDKVGKIGQSSIEALNNALAAQGMSGGGAQVQGTRDIAENAAGNLGNEVRSETEQQVQTDLDVAKQNQATALTQRGQDIQAQEAAAQLAQAQAEFNATNSLNMLKIAMGGGNVLGSLY